MVNLGIIGCGAIGSDVAKAAEDMNDISSIYLYDINKKAEDTLCKNLKKAVCMPVPRFLDKVDVVFEAASQQAVRKFAEMILEKEKPILVMI